MQKILVWDAPVRVFHWTLVLSFAGAWLTAEADGWRLVHVTFGWTVVGLVLLRLLWGLVGTRYARFAQFVRGPRQVAVYVRQLLSGRNAHEVGHNPLGAVVIVVLLALGLAVPLSGWAALGGIGGELFEEVHEFLAEGMLLMVGAHIVGVFLASLLHREPLVAAMFTGRKPGESGQGLRSAWWPLALLLLAAVLGFWLMQWRAAAQGGWIQPGQVLAAEQGDED